MASYQNVLTLIKAMQTNLDLLKDELERLAAQNEVAEDIDSDELELSHVVPPTYPDEEIVGGDETDAYPDCCAVGNAVNGYFCSGTLIAPNLVVTAAHCQQISQVFLKGNDVTAPEAGEVIPIVQTHTHPDLDLRVLVLAHASGVTPRRIAASALVANATQATLVGFGTVDFNGTVGYGRKRRVTVPITTLDCAADGEAREYGCVKGFEIVAGQRGLDKDSCRGDSGGPLYIQDAAGNYFLLGATSRGARGSDRVCGDGGIYMRVDLCLDWIEQVTGVKLVAG